MSLPIVCSACGEHVYDLADDHSNVLRAADLVPAREDVRRPCAGDLVLCPLCGSGSLMVEIRRVALSSPSQRPALRGEGSTTP